jgi:purine-binding chemotaxis protein CheW
MNSLVATQYITFKIGDELFAIDVISVREVLELSLITRIPDAPAHLRGMVNVRGEAIPVVDLRAKFGLEPIPDSVHTRIVVLEIDVDGQRSVLGGIADSVHEVIDFEAEMISPPPRFATRWKGDLIKGVARRNEELIIILSTDAVFSGNDMEQVETAVAQTGSANGAGAPQD